MIAKMYEIIVANRKKLVPYLFTDRQVDLIEKYMQGKSLTPSEKTYLYATINKKMSALNLFKEEFYITGSAMLPDRVEQAKDILNSLSYPCAFISGSFLYKNDYNDIDIFVIAKRRKSYRLENKHFTFITEHDLCKPFFASAARYSVATFNPMVHLQIEKQGLQELLFVYQWVINQALEGEDQKELRDLVFQYSLHVKKTILDARSLDLQVQELKNLALEERIGRINFITKELLLTSYSLKYVYHAFSHFIKSVKEIGKEYKTPNIPVFLHFAKEVQYACRKTQV